jgi:general stress protein 26
MSQHKDHPLAAQRQLADLIGKDRFAMLTEPGTGELLESRPMTLLEFDAQGLLWFFCRRQADARPHPVNLAFSDEVHSTFVSIAGRAEQVDDRERIHALWTAAARPWFPDGPDSPDLALLKIVPLKVEYWDAPDSRVVRGLALAAPEGVRAVPGRGTEGEAGGRSFLVGSLRWMEELGVDLGPLQAQAAQWQRDGATVSALAERVLEGPDVGTRYALRALLAFGDEPKPGAREALALLRARGVRCVMVSGDNRGAAEAMARRLGLQPEAGEVMAEVLPGDRAAVRTPSPWWAMA